MADNENADGSSGSRGENSVLFSLSNLTAVGAADQKQQKKKRQDSGGGAGQAQKDASGLIDLNTLTQLGAGSPAAGDAGADAGADASANAVPALFNVGTRRSNKGLVIGIGFLVLVVLSLGGFLTYLLVFKEDPDAGKSAVAAEEPDPEEEELGIEGDAVANKAKTVSSDGEDGEGETKDGEDGEGETKDGEGDEKKSVAAQAIEDSDNEDDKKKRSSSGSSSRRSDSGDKKKKKKGSKVDSALDRARGDSGGNKLKPSDVKKVLSGASLKAKKCGSGGSVKVKFNIRKSGSTSGVVVIGGSKARGPEANCVKKIVKRLSFPKSTNGARGVKFPFRF